MRRAFLTAGSPIVLPAIGAAFMGGYFVGVIDTTKGNIIASDASQVGLRYALISAPKSLQVSRAYKTTADAAPAAARTRWDGLAATAAMAADAATYPAADYCAGLTYPSDSGSPWYLAAMDERELIYRNFKPTTENNYTTANTTSTFPGGTQAQGYNPSCDPAGLAYTSGTPAKTSVALFQDGGSEDFGDLGVEFVMLTATEFSATAAWYQHMSGAASGAQSSTTKTTTQLIRPVRRVLL